MKTYSKEELIEFSKPVFEANPREQLLLVTIDGQFFLPSKRFGAHNHAQKYDFDIYEVTKDGDFKKIPSADELNNAKRFAEAGKSASDSVENFKKVLNLNPEPEANADEKTVDPVEPTTEPEANADEKTVDPVEPTPAPEANADEKTVDPVEPTPAPEANADEKTVDPVEPTPAPEANADEKTEVKPKTSPKAPVKPKASKNEKAPTKTTPKN